MTNIKHRTLCPKCNTLVSEGERHACTYLTTEGLSITHTIEAPNPLPDNLRTQVLQKANAAVNSDRQNTYGTPENNFQTIANLWNAYWRGVEKVRSEGSFFFMPHDVAILLDLVKTARLTTSPQHLDNWVDKAGYSACGAEVAGAKP